MPQSPAISIVTTVYDAKEFLPRAVQSILAQTFTDFELLLVDDGSPNGCGELCDALAKTDARIRVFHKPNGGPASASNTGLDNARGAYIGFVNADDLIEPEMYERLYGAIQTTGARIAACSEDYIDENDVLIPGRSVVCRTHGVRDAMDLFLEAFQDGNFYGPMSSNKLFDIRTFRDKGVHYDETMHFGDDASVLHLVFEGERMVCLPDVLYHYRSRRGQITDMADFPPRKLDDLRMYWNWLQYFAARPDSAEYYTWAVVRFWKWLYQFFCLADAAGRLGELRSGFEPYCKNLRTVLPDLLRGRLVPVTEKLRALAFSLSPDLTYGLAACWGRLVRKFAAQPHTRKG